MDRIAARWLAAAMVVVVIGGMAATHVWGQKAAPKPEDRAKAEKLMADGNFNEAYKVFRELAHNELNDPKLVANDLANGVQALRNLGRITEVDEFIETTIAAHGKNWRLLSAAANQYLQIEHFGFMIAGKYERGHNRGGGKMVNSQERDRVRALQLLNQAIPLANADEDKAAVSEFYITLAGQLLSNRGHTDAWRLQTLTNLAELPDYEEGYYFERQYNGAPVGADGKPVYHHEPKSWEEAKTDGERWRWALAQAVENSPSQRNRVRWEMAQFYMNQFAPQTMSYWGLGRFFGLPATDDDTKKNESGTYALHTLQENETIAKLATGIKRFELPDEFNYIKIMQQIAAEPQTGFGDEALYTLATEFENRRQYPKAATYWQQSLENTANRTTGSRNASTRSWGSGAGLNRSPASRPAAARRSTSAIATPPR
jgi:hypothetical protein